MGSSSKQGGVALKSERLSNETITPRIHVTFYRHSSMTKRGHRASRSLQSRECGGVCRAHDCFRLTPTQPRHLGAGCSNPQPDGEEHPRLS